MPSKKKRYNARFPPARIKKIMQTDDDVGKVAAAVPVIISRVLELFIESLIQKSGETTLSRNARTLSTSHIKQTILSEKKFDFLKELVEGIPDVSPTDDETPPLPSGGEDRVGPDPAVKLSTIGGEGTVTEGVPQVITTGTVGKEAPRPRGRPRKVKPAGEEERLPKKRGRKRKEVTARVTADSDSCDKEEMEGVGLDEEDAASEGEIKYESRDQGKAKKKKKFQAGSETLGQKYEDPGQVVNDNVVLAWQQQQQAHAANQRPLHLDHANLPQQHQYELQQMQQQQQYPQQLQQQYSQQKQQYLQQQYPPQQLPQRQQNPPQRMQYPPQQQQYQQQQHQRPEVLQYSPDFPQHRPNAPHFMLDGSQYPGPGTTPYRQDGPQTSIGAPQLRPELTQYRPEALQQRQKLMQDRPETSGYGTDEREMYQASVVPQCRPDHQKYRSEDIGHWPDVVQHRPDLNHQHQPVLNQHRPELNQHRPGLQQINTILEPRAFAPPFHRPDMLHQARPDSMPYLARAAASQQGPDVRGFQPQDPAHQRVGFPFEALSSGAPYDYPIRRDLLPHSDFSPRQPVYAERMIAANSVDSVSDGMIQINGGERIKRGDGMRGGHQERDGVITAVQRRPGDDAPLNLKLFRPGFDAEVAHASAVQSQGGCAAAISAPPSGFQGLLEAPLSDKGRWAYPTTEGYPGTFPSRQETEPGFHGSAATVRNPFSPYRPGVDQTGLSTTVALNRFSESARSVAAIGRDFAHGGSSKTNGNASTEGFREPGRLSDGARLKTSGMDEEYFLGGQTSSEGRDWENGAGPGRLIDSQGMEPVNTTAQNNALPPDSLSPSTTRRPSPPVALPALPLAASSATHRMPLVATTMPPHPFVPLARSMSVPGTPRHAAVTVTRNAVSPPDDDYDS